MGVVFRLTTDKDRDVRFSPQITLIQPLEELSKLEKATSTYHPPHTLGFFFSLLLQMGNLVRS